MKALSDTGMQSLPCSRKDDPNTPKGKKHNKQLLQYVNSADHKLGHGVTSPLVLYSR